jgi:outer membrane biosynthesis protein TonB
VKLKDIPTPTLITGGAVVLWLGTFVLRAVNPEFSGGPAADALVATVVAWWAKTRADAHGKDDLIAEVLTKNVLPMVSNTPTPTLPPAAPKPAPPMPPKPATPPKPGGLPWGS